MRRILPALLLAACSEYDIVDPDAVPPGVPNGHELDDGLRVDRFEQLTAPKTDILWVVDSSRSMSDERDALAEWFPKFIDHFIGIDADFHIGVVSTDMGNYAMQGVLQFVDDTGWIDKDTPDAQEVFSKMTAVYNPLSDTSGWEKGREAAYTALELRKDDFNAGFLRDDPEAWLHIIVVSDEDDSSTRDPIGKADFVDWINTIRPLTFRTTWNSIVTLHPKSPQEERGQDYLDLTEQIGGEVFDLQQANWPEVLDILGGLQAPAPIQEWFLSLPPVPESLEVAVESGAITFVFDPDEDYTWDPIRNSVTFTSYLPPEGSAVILTYVPAVADYGSE